MRKARTRWSRRRTEGAVLVLMATMTACAHPQAKTVAAAPVIPLDVPLPPPRAVEPITADALPVVGPVPEPGSASRPSPPPSQNAPRADTPRVEAPHAEPAPEPPKPADDTTAKPAGQQPAAPTLQITPVQREGEVEARIRAELNRATTDLNRVDYGRLNVGARSQYDFAKRSVSQAEEAIRTRNLAYAQALADKAADIAAQLAGR